MLRIYLLTLYNKNINNDNDKSEDENFLNCQPYVYQIQEKKTPYTFVKIFLMLLGYGLFFLVDPGTNLKN